MIIQVHTDNHIPGSQDLNREVEGVVEGAMERFENRITRVEVHLSDEDGSQRQQGPMIRCRMEARPANRQPVVVSADGESVELAVQSAAEKLERLLASTFDRLDTRKGNTPSGGEPGM
jgi:hypothetical protein